MKQFFSIKFLVLLTIFLSVNFRADAAIFAEFESKTNKFDVSSGKQPVLLELFTSEGCPVCPPADRNLTFLQTEQPFAQADLITLSLHVDYWNSGGWKDEFSSPMFTRRQDIYRQVFEIGSIYTPQMVVDGQSQFAGTDLAKVQKAIIENAKNEKGKVELTATSEKNGGIKLEAKIFDLPKHASSTIFLAVAEDDLAANGRRGSSNTKTVFTSVVRELKSLGFLTAEQKSLEAETILQLQPNWKMKNIKLVVFAQENGSRKIFGIGKLDLSKKQ